MERESLQHDLESNEYHEKKAPETSDFKTVTLLLICIILSR